jgi:hypothetical protein
LLKDANRLHCDRRHTAMAGIVVFWRSDGSFNVVTLHHRGRLRLHFDFALGPHDPAVAAVTVSLLRSLLLHKSWVLAAPALIDVDESTTLSWGPLQDAAVSTSGGTAQWQALTIDGSSSSGN